MNAARLKSGVGLNEGGFTLIEMLFATVIVLVGLVAVAQLVPVSLLMNANNRNDGTALILAQRELEAMKEVPLSLVGTPGFTDPQGVLCPLGQTCLLGDPTQPKILVGSPVVIFQGAAMIDFTAAPVAGYSFTYTDPNDPLGAQNDIRWAVITNVNAGQIVVSRRIILGVFRRGMRTPSYPITLDVMIEK